MLDKREELLTLAKKCVIFLKDKYKVKRVFLICSLVKGLLHYKSNIYLVVEGVASELYIKALTDLYDLLLPQIELNLIPLWRHL